MMNDFLDNRLGAVNQLWMLL